MTDPGQPKAPVKTGPKRSSVTIPGRNVQQSEFHPPISNDALTTSVPPASDLSEEPLDAAGYLLRALGTQIPGQKKKMAQLGLRARASDEELKALLLRQLYLAELEEENDAAALEIATEMIRLGTLGDVARQDASRAALAMGDLQAAIEHLRIAARVCPSPRRSFHYAHLGALLRFDAQTDQAIEAFARAARWATEDRSLYHAIYALAEMDEGDTEADLHSLRDALEASGRRGYALWVLGELSLKIGDETKGREYLEQFLGRVTDAPRAKTLSLRSEIRHCRTLLSKISA